MTSERPRQIVIRPARGWSSVSLVDIWDYRYLILYFINRDIFAIYRQTVLGVGWALIGPIMTMIVFTFIFGHIARIPSDNLPYPIFAFAALTAWTYFSTAMGRCTNSLLENSAIITKVYFPRLALLLVPICSAMVNFVIAFAVLLCLMAYFGITPRMEALFAVPLLLLMAAIAAITLGLWLAPLNVQFRDVSQGMPFLIQFLMYATPIAYPLSAVPEPFHTILQWNPMTHVVNGFRWSLLGADSAPDLHYAILSMLSVTVLFIGGLFWFRYMEKTFADVV